MFSLPTLPTDSLYKFIFIGGLILLIFSAYLDQNQLDSSTKENFNMDSLQIVKNSYAQMDSLNNLNDDKRLKYLGEAYKSTSVQYADMIKKKSSVAEIGIIKEMNDRYSREMNQIILKHDSLTKDYHRTYIEFQLRQSRYEMNEKLSKSHHSTSNMCFYSGVIMFLLGGFLWCYRIQIPQDEIQKIQLDLAKLELQRQNAIPVTSPPATSQSTTSQSATATTVTTVTIP